MIDQILRSKPLYLIIYGGACFVFGAKSMLIVLAYLHYRP